ncbi:hypothetical protein KIPB_002503 [Kipferlia bialata]|uniref:Uncharacterized protein n=1 Tax=Kipferlia bialata TaxID=797122 RepID=A0A391NJG4_9EUKA|nr:hypothetical protein KIPB_002503 [Kipferlia bialata]|eukprot:g2503.t1
MGGKRGRGKKKQKEGDGAQAQTPRKGNRQSDKAGGQGKPKGKKHNTPKSMRRAYNKPTKAITRPLPAPPASNLKMSDKISQIMSNMDKGLYSFHEVEEFNPDAPISTPTHVTKTRRTETESLPRLSGYASYSDDEYGYDGYAYDEDWDDEDMVSEVDRIHYTPEELRKACEEMGRAAERIAAKAAAEGLARGMMGMGTGTVGGKAPVMLDSLRQDALDDEEDVTDEEVEEGEVLMEGSPAPVKAQPVTEASVTEGVSTLTVTDITDTKETEAEVEEAKGEAECSAAEADSPPTETKTVSPSDLGEEAEAEAECVVAPSEETPSTEAVSEAVAAEE